MVQVDMTLPKSGSTQNDNLTVPQASIFFGGKIINHVGAFAQITYDNTPGAANFGADNIDIRYANSAKLNGMMVDYGLTVNNNPTVQDLWNSTAAWGYPYAGGLGLGNTQLDGIGADVVGLGAYAMWNNWLYTEFDAYQGSKASGLLNVFHFTTLPSADAKDGYVYNDGTAPYVRIAVQHNFGNNYVMVGGQYLETKQIGNYYTPTPDATIDYKDYAIDAEWQYTKGDHLVTAEASNAWETQSQTGSADVKTETLKGKISYFFKQKYGVEFNYVTTKTDSATDNTGTTVQLDYFIPTQNIKLAAQFNNYTKYDGTSVGASDNNNVYLVGWFMF